MNADVYLDGAMIYIDHSTEVGAVGLSVFTPNDKATVILKPKQAKIISELLAGNTPASDRRFYDEELGLNEYYLHSPLVPEQE